MRSLYVLIFLTYTTTLPNFLHAGETDRSIQNNSYNASIEKLEGTLVTYADPVFSDGKIWSCTIVFQAFVKDRIYRNGQFVKVYGNYGLSRINNGIGTTLKVGVAELNHESLEFEYSRPSRIYIISKDLKTNFDSILKSTPSDDPGALFVIFKMNPTLDMIIESLEKNSVTIAFNQNNGSTDMKLEVDLTVESTSDEGKRIKSSKTIEDFMSCYETLFSDIIK